MVEDLDLESLTSASRLGASSVRELPPPSEADEDVANMYDLQSVGALSPGAPLTLVYHTSPVLATRMCPIGDLHCLRCAALSLLQVAFGNVVLFNHGSPSDF